MLAKSFTNNDISTYFSEDAMVWKSDADLQSAVSDRESLYRSFSTPLFGFGRLCRCRFGLPAGPPLSCVSTVGTACTTIGVGFVAAVGIEPKQPSILMPATSPIIKAAVEISGTQTYSTWVFSLWKSSSRALSRLSRDCVNRMFADST